MRKYRRAFQSIHNWLLILKPGQCIEFIAADFGIKAFLMKPVLKEYLATMVRKVLDEAKDNTQQ